MLGLQYTIVIPLAPPCEDRGLSKTGDYREATEDPNSFGFYSPDLEGFSGVGKTRLESTCAIRGNMEATV